MKQLITTKSLPLLSLVRIMENKPEENKKKGQMVAFYIPVQLARFIQSQFEDVKGDMVKPHDMHITLGLVDDTREKLVAKLLRQAAKEISPFDVEIDGVDVFPPHESNDQTYVLHAIPKSEMFDVIHQKVFDLFHDHGIDINNGSHEFNPHITIKYCQDQPSLDKKIKMVFPVKDIYFASFGKKRRYKLNE